MRINIDRKLADGDRCIESMTDGSEFNLDNILIYTAAILFIAVLSVVLSSLTARQFLAWFQAWGW
jgi:hypothetical protein|tara:strand:- start:1238 stop:1432 length:195 start_codon:yes stop_codon:yes gene_type:complete